jgi:hypothetical protein
MKIFASCLLVSSLTVFSTASTLPFTETFDTLTNNLSVNGQNGWVLESGTADVQSTVTNTSPQALQVQSGSVSHELSSDGTAIWLHFMARISAAPDSDPIVSNNNTSVAFFVNTNLNVVVYSNTTPVELDVPMPINTWTRFDIYCDYDGLTWDLAVDGANVSEGLPLYSNNRSIESVLIANNSASSVFVDEINISDTELAAEVPDSDKNDIPDWWQRKHMGGVNSGNATAVTANNGLTYLQAYIAGLDPTGSDQLLAEKVPGNRGLKWASLPGRLYDIYWSPDLETTFTMIREGVSGSEFTDTEHDTPAGFYKLKARLP